MHEEYPQANTLLDRIDSAVTRSGKWIFALFGFAFLIKLVFIIQSADSLQVMVPILDAKYYDKTAQDIAAGHIIREEAFFMGPLYSYFLAVVYSAIGRHFLFVRIIQILGGSLAVVLTYLIGKKVFRPSVSLLAGLLLIFYGTATFYEGQLLMMWLGTLLNMSLLYVLLDEQRGKGLKRYALAGFLIGLSALARANILIFYPVAIFWIFKTEIRQRWTASFIFTAVMILTILPATLHNYIASRDFVPITSNGGVNFYIGNSKSATGVFYLPRGVDFNADATTRQYIERLLGRDLKPSEVSRYWFGQAFDFIRNHPLEEIELLFRKIALFANGSEIPQIESYDLSRERFGVLRFLFVNFWILWGLGTVGMIYSLKRWKACFLLYGFIVSFSASIILFFITARYRVQIAPVLSIFAAHALLEVFPNSLRTLRRAFPPFAIFALVLMLTQPRLFALAKEEVFWREHVHQARRLDEIGNRKAALEEINRAIELLPDNPDSYIHRAIIYKNGGMLFQAIDNYEKALRLAPAMPDVHYDLAQSMRQLGLYEAAAEEYIAAIELDPLMIEAHNNLGITYREMKLFGNAIECFEKVIEMDPNYTKAYNNLGSSYAESGRFEEAEKAFKKAIERDPDYAHAYKNLAGVYIQVQELDVALEYIERYLLMRPEDQQAINIRDQLRIVLEGDTLGEAP